MIEGSCLCGAVRYRAEGLQADASHCHCSMCRKAHGAAFGTYATVTGGRFTWVRGEEFVTRYRSSEKAERTFCSKCGSTLQFVANGQIDLALGTVDGDPGVRPQSHIFVASKTPWYTITDDLPQFKTRP